MPLREEFETTGKWLFRWRSYLPIVLIILIFPGIHSIGYPGNSILYDIAALLISFVGLAIRCLVIGCKPKHTSGGNIRKQRAEVLNTKGLYSIVRHPLYLGIFFIWMYPYS